MTLQSLCARPSSTVSSVLRRINARTTLSASTLVLETTLALAMKDMLATVKHVIRLIDVSLSILYVVLTALVYTQDLGLFLALARTVSRAWKTPQSLSTASWVVQHAAGQSIDAKMVAMDVMHMQHAHTRHLEITRAAVTRVTVATESSVRSSIDVKTAVMAVQSMHSAFMLAPVKITALVWMASLDSVQKSVRELTLARMPMAAAHLMLLATSSSLQ